MNLGLVGQPDVIGIHEGQQGGRGLGKQLGTTRMSSSPRDGVVDADARTHDVPNLYIAGGSVFPTVGFANPTLTILALSLRLAEELETQLRRPSSLGSIW